MSNASTTKSIPVRRVQITEPQHMPSRYSETPGGTIFSTTPGGTRIIYERKFLLDLKSSPLSQTPTKLPIIPGVTLDSNGKIIEEEEEDLNNKIPECPKAAQNGDAKKSNDDDLFAMDM
ncbi:eukaryotic translation initiation factor 4E-binding protein 2-like [Hydractinia symbiolongicarpus]|uniref:eukaryotic translation initiation factor 4E-binding protein 2-like n=1 Tax=Hydractinia symbiolongicarpus TaxID=13093 RepID=UPI00254FB66F|nr:eukaryotic translation initiation factor 4E-binding protein 2-like [Hydractinia symbiolongicarpus]